MSAGEGARTILYLGLKFLILKLGKIKSKHKILRLRFPSLKSAMEPPALRMAVSSGGDEEPIIVFAHTTRGRTGK
jgi:hypothetical protein